VLVQELFARSANMIKDGAQDARLPYDYAKAVTAEASSPVEPGLDIVQGNIMPNQENRIDPKAAQKKLRIASDLFDMAVKIKSHQLKLKFPQASPAEIRAKVMELIERGCR
jgi:hypothetical protein